LNKAELCNTTMPDGVISNRNCWGEHFPTES
jgi:hypothetical protein